MTANELTTLGLMLFGLGYGLGLAVTCLVGSFLALRRPDYSRGWRDYSFAHAAEDYTPDLKSEEGR